MRPLSATLFTLCLGVLPLCAIGQESINYASVAGRVTDPQGAAVAGAEVTARHSQTNVKAGVVTDAGRALPLPVPQDRPVRASLVRQAGLQGGHAARWPSTRAPPSSSRSRLEVGGLEESVTVTGDALVLETARSQIAGTVSSAEVGGAAHERPQFPGPRAAGARRVADQHGQHPALRRDLGRARAAGSRWPASATSPTASSSTACPPTTTPPASAASPWPWSRSSSSRSSPRAGRPSWAARSAATSTS